MESPHHWWSCPLGGGPESHWTTLQSFKLLIVSGDKVWIKAYVITEAELWLWETLPAIICVIRSHESRCVWGLKCLGGALKAEIQMADNWCCRPSFTPLSTYLYSHDFRVDQQLSGPPQTGQSHWGPLAFRSDETSWMKAETSSWTKKKKCICRYFKHWRLRTSTNR